VQHERVARCEVAELHLAKFGSDRVRYSGVAPCDVFWIILGKSGGNAKVDANVYARAYVLNINMRSSGSSCRRLLKSRATPFKGLSLFPEDLFDLP